jgi:DNA-binding Lrp family transcriptional regulator
MANTTSNQELGERIERLVQEHIVASRRAAQEAVERAFASTTRVPVRARREVRTSAVGKRRTPAEMAALAEQLLQAVCVNPGETIAVIAAQVGASARELHRPMSLLKREGRVRSVGARSSTRYFPMTNGAAASA